MTKDISPKQFLALCVVVCASFDLFFLIFRFLKLSLFSMHKLMIVLKFEIPRKLLCTQYLGPTKISWSFKSCIDYCKLPMSLMWCGYFFNVANYFMPFDNFSFNVCMSCNFKVLPSKQLFCLHGLLYGACGGRLSLISSF